MSAVRLLVLGILKTQRRAHGYAVHRELTAWHVDTWTTVRPGSIYHALKQLTKEGKLRSVGEEESAEGPGRTLYEITKEGGTEFSERLEAALASFDLEQLGAGIAFIHLLPRDKAVALLRDTSRRADQNQRYLETLIPDFPDRAEPPHMADLLGLWSAALAATAGWTAGLARRLEAGDYVMAGEPVRSLRKRIKTP